MSSLEQAVNLLRRAELSRCFLMNRQCGVCNDCLSNDIEKFLQSYDKEVVSLSDIQDAINQTINDMRTNK